MKTKTQIQQYFETLPVGGVVNKKGLAYLKRMGYIWDYSRFGYLESVTITGRKKNENDYEPSIMAYTFGRGNAKELEQYEGAMYEKWRQGRACTNLTSTEIYDRFDVSGHFILNGIMFKTQYFDGCFNAYLVKAGPANGKVENHRMAFPGGVI